MLFGMSPIIARGVGGAIPAPAQKPPQPIPQQIPQVPQKGIPPIMPQKPQPAIPKPVPVQQPIAQERSYKDLVIYIKNSGNVWDASRSILSGEFVRTIVQKARALRLSNLQVEALLQTARDMHAQFSGDKNKDIAILQAINKQIAAAI